METGVQDGFLGYLLQVDFGLDDTKNRRRLVLWKIMQWPSTTEIYIGTLVKRPVICNARK